MWVFFDSFSQQLSRWKDVLTILLGGSQGSNEFWILSHTIKSAPSVCRVEYRVPVSSGYSSLHCTSVISALFSIPSIHLVFGLPLPRLPSPSSPCRHNGLDFSSLEPLMMWPEYSRPCLALHFVNNSCHGIQLLSIARVMVFNCSQTDTSE